jgi:hypothetical protein
MSEAARNQPTLPGIEPRRIVADDMSAPEIDAKIAAAEARTDTKFAQVQGTLSMIARDLARLSEDNRATRTTVRNTGWALAGLIIAVAAMGITVFGIMGDRFIAGMSASEIADRAAERAMLRSFEAVKASPPTTPVAK